MREPAPSTPSDDGQRYLGLTPTQLNVGFLAIFWTGVVVALFWVFAWGGKEKVSDSASGIWGDVAHRYEQTDLGYIGKTPEQAAEGAVLTIGDVPPGWGIAPETGDDDDELALSPECQSLVTEAPFDGEQARRDSRLLKGPESQIAISEARVFASPEQAQAVLDTLRSDFARCKDQLIAALTLDAAENGVQSQLALDEVAALSLGESSMLIHGSGTFSGQLGTVPFVIDIAFVRHGRMTATVLYSHRGEVPVAESQTIIEAAARKLERETNALS